MTINNTTLGRVAYLGNGTATVFTVPFVFSNASDLEVIRTVISTGVETVLTITSDYTVSGGGLIPATGSVTFLTAPTADHRITIRREVPNTQLVDFVENDTLPAAVQESALDKLTLQIQDLKENVDRAVLFTPGSGQSSVSIATAVPDYLLGWNSSGTIIESVDPSTLTGPAGQGVPTGGTAGQVLSKIDGTNFNTQWVTPSAGGGDIVKLETKIVTTATSTIEFVTGLSSTYSSYILRGFAAPSSSFRSLNMRLSQNGGSTWISAAGSYAHNAFALGGSGTANSSDTQIFLNNASETVGSGGAYFDIVIQSIAGVRTAIVGQILTLETAPNMTHSVAYTLYNGVNNGIQLYFNGGTIGNAQFTLYGVKA